MTMKVYTRNSHMAHLDVVNKSEVQQRYSHKLPTGVDFVAGEWAKVGQNAASDGDVLTAVKVSATPGASEMGLLYVPSFTSTAINSSAAAIGEGAFVHPSHEALTDYYTAASGFLTGTELTLGVDGTKNGQLQVATSGDIVVAKCTAGPTPRYIWAQGAPPGTMIKYVSVENYVKA
jgi:hypothetical protein